jgi:Lrp/AsnC family transcriptional regulator for asnA, asnC and gidA
LVRKTQKPKPQAISKMKQIDETDSKILTTLLRESRTSFTEMATMCGISVTAIIRRYRRLKKAGIILGEHMYLNPLSVGYGSMVEIGIITDLADTEKFIESLKIKSLTLVSSNPIGKYNITGLARALKLDDLMEQIQKMDIKPYVKSLDTLIYSELWKNQWHPENLVVKPSKEEKTIKKHENSQTKFEQVSLDETDKSIAQMLMDNSRMSFKKIAEKLEISTNNVIQRYKHLREKNVLNLSTISVDLYKLGYNGITDCYIKVENRGNLPDVEAQLLQIPNAIFCVKFLGGAYDIRVAVMVSDFEDIFSLKKDVRSISHIKKAEFYLHDIPPAWPVDFIAGDLIKSEKLGLNSLVTLFYR